MGAGDPVGPGPAMFRVMDVLPADVPHGETIVRGRDLPLPERA